MSVVDSGIDIHMQCTRNIRYLEILGFPYVIMNLGKLAMWVCANTAENFVVHGTKSLICMHTEVSQVIY